MASDLAKSLNCHCPVVKCLGPNVLVKTAIIRMSILQQEKQKLNGKTKKLVGALDKLFHHLGTSLATNANDRRSCTGIQAPIPCDVTFLRQCSFCFLLGRYILHRTSLFLFRLPQERRRINILIFRRDVICLFFFVPMPIHVLNESGKFVFSSLLITSFFHIFFIRNACG